MFGGEVDMFFNIILRQAKEGGFDVTVPALDGCFTQGETEAEALANAKEAIICYLEGLEKLNQIKLSHEAVTKKVESRFIWLVCVEYY